MFVVGYASLGVLFSVGNFVVWPFTAFPKSAPEKGNSAGEVFVPGSVDVVCDACERTCVLDTRRIYRVYPGGNLCAELQYPPLWGNSTFYFIVRSLPAINPKPPFDSYSGFDGIVFGLVSVWVVLLFGQRRLRIVGPAREICAFPAASMSCAMPATVNNGIHDKYTCMYIHT